MDNNFLNNDKEINKLDATSNSQKSESSSTNNIQAPTSVQPGEIQPKQPTISPVIPSVTHEPSNLQKNSNGQPSSLVQNTANQQPTQQINYAFVPNNNPNNQTSNQQAAYNGIEYLSQPTQPTQTSSFTAAPLTPIQPPAVNLTKNGKSKDKKGFFITKKVAAFVVIAGILVSGAVGYGGAYWAMKNGTSVNGNVIYQNVAEKTTPTSNPDGSLSIQQIAEKNMNSVVEISTKSKGGASIFGGSVKLGSGSGVIFTANGYIVTNHHVIEDEQASDIFVRLKNGKEYKATLIGSQPKYDIAVIKIDEKDLTPVVLGDSDKLKEGEVAVAIGNPLGKLGGTVTNGIISALDRELTIDGNTMRLLQTNAAINPGNSGGGLFDSRGNLIGIVNAKSSGSGIEGLAFAIPINSIKSTIDSLINKGHVDKRPQLGITAYEVKTTDDALKYNVDKTGIYIESVTSGSGADKAGLKKNDLILSVNGTKINTLTSLQVALDKQKAGDTVSVEVLRDNKTITAKVKLSEGN